MGFVLELERANPAHLGHGWRHGNSLMVYDAQKNVVDNAEFGRAASLAFVRLQPEYPARVWGPEQAGERRVPLGDQRQSRIAGNDDGPGAFGDLSSTEQRRAVQRVGSDLYCGSDWDAAPAVPVAF